MYLIKGNKMRGCDRNGISVYFNYFYTLFLLFRMEGKHKGNCLCGMCGVDSINVSSYRALLFRTVPK